MKELTKYLENSKRYKISYIEQNYLTQEVKDILAKYKLTLHELCYRIKHNIPFDKKFTCLNCGKEVGYDLLHHCYHEFCNNKCSLIYRNKSQEHKDKINKTCLKKYGVANYCQSSKHLKLLKDNKETIINKMQQTCIDKYGVNTYFKTQEFKDKQKANEVNRIKKYKKTCQEKYNTDSYSKTKEYKKFIKDHRDEIQDKIKHTCLDKYGVTSYNKTQEFKDRLKQTCLNKYLEVSNLQVPEIQDQIKQTCLKKYSVDNYAKTQEFKDRLKKACIKKYGTEYYTQTQEYKEYIKLHQEEIQAKMKQTCLEKYGVENYCQTPEFIQKMYNTKKKNNSFHISKEEEKAYNILLTKFSKDDIIRQYKSDLYPFACDFYIKSLDLYIEYNGTWTHGIGSFDSNNLDHIKLLNKWKSKNTDFYRTAIYTWTDLDVRKLETFKKNKLNYKIFWNLKEVKDWINSLK